VEQLSQADEHFQDPRNFYASESPVSRNSDSEDHELYESAEEFGKILEPEGQNSGQVGVKDINISGTRVVRDFTVLNDVADY
jgi:hypothetical protein